MTSTATSAPARTGGRGPVRWRRTVVIAVAVAAVVAVTAYAVAAARDSAVVLGPGVVTVEVSIQHSRYDIGSLRVQEGTLVEFVVHNEDPIDHELVIGTPEVHRRHAEGTEARHPPIPGEVSLAPGDTAKTFYEFDQPGTVTYACHLPGHVAYGMTGTVEVVPAS